MGSRPTFSDLSLTFNVDPGGGALLACQLAAVVIAGLLLLFIVSSHLPLTHSGRPRGAPPCARHPSSSSPTLCSASARTAARVSAWASPRCEGTLIGNVITTIRCFLRSLDPLNGSRVSLRLLSLLSFYYLSLLSLITGLWTRRKSSCHAV